MILNEVDALMAIEKQLKKIVEQLTILNKKW